MTGATSFLGRNVLIELLKEGHRVYAMVRKTSPAVIQLPKDKNVTYIYGALDELDKICNEVTNADVFIHFAWDGSGYVGRTNYKIQSQNIAYSMNALEISKKLGCKEFLFAGSQAEYGIIHNIITEDTLCHPISEYGKAKLEFARQAKIYCSQKEIRFIHLRIFSVYGFGDRESTLVNTCVKRFNCGEIVQLGACTQKWNYLHITDFVNVIKLILRHDGMDGIYNIASMDTRILKEFVQEIYELSNQSGSYKLDKIAANPEGSPELEPDITKIKNLLGWEPVIPFSKGVVQIMDKLLGEKR